MTDVTGNGGGSAQESGPAPRRPAVPFDVGERVTLDQEYTHWAALLGVRAGVRAESVSVAGFLDRMRDLEARMRVRWGRALTALELGTLTECAEGEMCALALAAFRLAARNDRTNDWLERACGWRAGELSAAEGLFCGVWRVDLPSGDTRAAERAEARAKAQWMRPETYWRDFYEAWWTSNGTELDQWQAVHPPPDAEGGDWPGFAAILAPVFTSRLDWTMPGCKGWLPDIRPAEPVDILALDPKEPTRFFSYTRMASAYPRDLDSMIQLEWDGIPKRLRLHRYPIDLLRDSAPARALETGVAPGVTSGRICVLDWMGPGADRLAKAIDNGLCVPVCDDAHHAEWLKKLVRESKPRLRFEIAAEMAASGRSTAAARAAAE